MTHLYKSTTGSVVNIKSYAISAHTGVELNERDPDLDAEVGKTLEYYGDEVQETPVIKPVVPKPILAPVEPEPEA